MNKKVLKWILLLSYIVFAFLWARQYSCPADSSRPLVLFGSLAFLVNLNINFFLKLPMNVPHLPEVRNVSNFRMRRRLLLISWSMFFAALLWGLVDDFSCAV
jgi:hypothetical protein